MKVIFHSSYCHIFFLNTAVIDINEKFLIVRDEQPAINIIINKKNIKHKIKYLQLIKVPLILTMRLSINDATSSVTISSGVRCPPRKSNGTICP